uniref:hypothetical protein n=1 Tax=Streptomyces chartreusis TaxID=1969 RepID=UPI003F49978D
MMTAADKPELDLDDEVEVLRWLAAAVVKQMHPGADASQQAQVLEQRAMAGHGLAERLIALDEQATVKRWTPRQWRPG